MENQNELETEAKKIKAILKKAEENEKKINDILQNTQVEQQTITDYVTQIEDQHNLICVDDDEGDSLSTQIEKAKNEADGLTEKIKEQHNLICVDDDEGDSLSTQIEKAKNEADGLTEKIKEQHNLICVDDDEGDSLSTQIEKAKNEADGLTEKIKEQHDLICVDNNERDSLSTQIEKAKGTIEGLEQKSQESNDAIQNTIQELQKFYYKVFGGQNQNGEKIEGIEDKLKAREKQTEQTLQKLEQDFNDFFENKKSELQEHYNRAKEAYDMSITGGLSKTFFNQAKVQKKEILFWNKVFIWSLVGISGITVFFAWFLGKDNLLDISAFFVRIIFILPSIWLAIFASQRRAESQRLAQEYTHKATTLQTYLLHKEEIKKLKKDDADLLSKLISSTIDTVAFNPSSSLDKTNKNKDYKNIIKDTKEIIKDTKEIIQEVSPHKDTKEIIQEVSPHKDTKEIIQQEEKQE